VTGEPEVARGVGQLGDGGQDPAAERLARAAWSRLVEPGDVVAGALVQALGAGAALRWVHRVVASGDARSGSAELSRAHETLDGAHRRLTHAVERWAPRLAGLDPRGDLVRLARLGGTLVVPGTPAWPPGLDGLGPAAPMCLWVRGEPDVARHARRSVSLVGARASTQYGERVAVDLADGLVARGAAVVSGGAYGIDAAAHRGTLAAGGATLVLLAGRTPSATRRSSSGSSGRAAACSARCRRGRSRPGAGSSCATA